MVIKKTALEVQVLMISESLKKQVLILLAILGIRQHQGSSTALPIDHHFLTRLLVENIKMILMMLRFLFTKKNEGFSEAVESFVPLKNDCWKSSIGKFGKLVIGSLFTS